MMTIAIDLGGTNIKIALIGEDAIIQQLSLQAFSENGLKPRLDDVRDSVNGLLTEFKIQQNELQGIGIAFPGLVDSVRNQVIATNKKYDDATEINLQNWANEKWNLPLHLENDARMALLGEWQQGAGKGYDNIVMVTLGTGIGSAVLIEGEMLKGKHFQAGNLSGHFIVNHRGTLCTCGNNGCMESEASTWRLPELIKGQTLYESSLLKNEKLLDYESLFKNAAQNDLLAKEILDHCFSVWSAGLISMIHAFDPEIIILGGGLLKSADVILPELQRRIDKYAWTPWGKVKLIEAKHSATAALFGADYLVRTNNLNKNNKT